MLQSAFAQLNASQSVSSWNQRAPLQSAPATFSFVDEARRLV